MVNSRRSHFFSELSFIVVTSVGFLYFPKSVVLTVNVAKQRSHISTKAIFIFEKSRHIYSLEIAALKGSVYPATLPPTASYIPVVIVDIRLRVVPSMSAMCPSYIWFLWSAVKLITAISEARCFCRAAKI